MSLRALKFAQIKSRQQLAEQHAKLFLARCHREDLPLPLRDYRFLTARKFQFAFAWPAERIALDIEEPIRDREKHNVATLNGWRVFWVAPKRLLATATLVMVGEALDSATNSTQHRAGAGRVRP